MMNSLILNGHFQDTIFQKFGSRDFRKYNLKTQAKNTYKSMKNEQF